MQISVSLTVRYIVSESCHDRSVKPLNWAVCLWVVSSCDEMLHWKEAPDGSEELAYKLMDVFRE